MLHIKLQQSGFLAISRQLNIGKYSIGCALFSDIRFKSKTLQKRHVVIQVNSESIEIDAIGDSDLFINDQTTKSLVNPANGTVIAFGDITLTIVDNPFVEPPTITNTIPVAVAAVAASGSVMPTEALAKAAPASQNPPRYQHSAQSLAWIDLKKQLQRKILERLDLYQRNKIDQYSDQQLRNEATDVALKILADNELALESNISTELLISETVAEAIGLGPLEPLLEDESITEIMVNGPSNIFVERKGLITRANTSFTGNASLQSVIERIVAPLGRRIDEASPMVDARLKDGSRVNAIIHPLSLIGPVLTIRKFSKKRFNMQSLVDFDSLSPQMATFLEVCVKNRKNIVVCGGTGSGKTTFLNALSDCIPKHERIITIEDAAELQLNQEHVISLESRPNNIENKGAVSIRELVRNSLRMRPDRIIVGECRGGETLDMLQAMNTGHDGSLTTAHSNSPRDLLSRLEVMVLMAGMDMPVRVIREQISSAVDIIVHQGRFIDGRRRVTSIVEVDGIEGEVILMQKLFEFRQNGVIDEKIQGEYRSLGIAPRFYEELRDSGVELDRSIFVQPE